VPRIVDGDNLLGGWPGRSRSEADKRQLSYELARLSRQEGRDILLVFDGSSPLGVAFGGSTRFAGQGQSADDLILAHLRAQRDPHGWIVITDDRRLGDQSRWAGARVERCETLRRRLVEGGEEKPTGPDDLDYWKDVFGVD
jgi:hypothetical protein